MAFISNDSSDTPGLVPFMNVYSEGDATLQLASRAGICQGTIEIVSKEVPCSVQDLTKQYEVPLSLIFHDILEDDHI